MCSIKHSGKAPAIAVTCSHANAFWQNTLALHFRAIHKITAPLSMEVSFFALPSRQGPVQGRFKPTHLPISLSARVAACVRRFETPTHLNHGRTESKKDTSMLFCIASFLRGTSTSNILCRIASDRMPVQHVKLPDSLKRYRREYAYGKIDNLFPQTRSKGSAQRRRWRR